MKISLLVLLLLLAAGPRINTDLLKYILYSEFCSTFRCRTNGQKPIKWISDFASYHWNAPKLEYWLLRTSCPINHIYVDGSFAIVCSSQPLMPYTCTHCEWVGVKYMYNAHTNCALDSSLYHTVHKIGWCCIRYYLRFYTYIRRYVCVLVMYTQTSHFDIDIYNYPGVITVCPNALSTIIIILCTIRSDESIKPFNP